MRGLCLPTRMTRPAISKEISGFNQGFSSYCVKHDVNARLNTTCRRQRSMIRQMHLRRLKIAPISSYKFAFFHNCTGSACVSMLYVSRHLEEQRCRIVSVSVVSLPFRFAPSILSGNPLTLGSTYSPAFPTEALKLCFSQVSPDESSPDSGGR